MQNSKLQLKSQRYINNTSLLETGDTSGGTPSKGAANNSSEHLMGVIRGRTRKLKFISLLFFFPLFYCFIVSLFNPHQVLAQSLSLSISPPILEVFIKPGKSITQVYKLTNDGDPVIVTPGLLELTEFGIKEDKKFIPEKWISIINTDLAFGQPFLLAPKKTKQIILKVNPPKDLPEKDYLRALVFSTKPNPAGETSQSSISQNLATPLLITVTSMGALPKGAQIEKFILPKLIDSFGPLEANIEVKNTGKTYFRPNGKITLNGPIGKGSFPIIPKIIFAGQTKKIFAEKNSKLGQKTLSLSGFFLGKYNLEVNFKLDQEGETISATKTFYAVPYKAGEVILSIMILLYILRKIKSRRKKKKQ